MKFAADQKYVKHKEDFESLLEFDTEKITDVLEEYVFFMQNRGDIAVGTDLAAPELFFEMNRKIWHNKIVRKGIRRLNRKKGGELPIEDSELESVYFGSNSPRKKCIISILSSLGIRPGALIDPVLCFKHLIPIEDCYGVEIYDESDDGYWGILIPEARKDVEAYKASRIRNGENITEDSPILATLPSRWNAKRDHVTDENLQELLARMIRGKVKRKKIGNRYDKAIVTMFRKRFNTKLKLNNNVNSNIAELVMAHKLPGAQGAYTKPTLREVYDAMKHAIPDLTIDSSARKEAELQKERIKKKEIEAEKAKLEKQLEQNQLAQDEVFRQARVIENMQKEIEKMKKNNSE
ncbi:MAG: hypothetical protein KC444_06570 [Nitrosopumilus sp.]|nr:hypothetical protein [Nitrosopumilus sp.]